MHPTEPMHPAATDHLPVFITAPGQTDYLFYAVIVFVLAAVLIIGNLYFKLHALPERMAHRTSVVQMEIVAVLCLIALFTHNNLYWIAALLLALVRVPDFSTPIASIAHSLERLSRRRTLPSDEPKVPPEPPPIQAKVAEEV